MRRIEALTGQGVFDYYNDLEKKLEEAAKTVKATPANLQEKLEHLMADLKSLQAENESLKSKAAKEALGDVMDQVQDVNGVKLLAVSVADVDMNGLRDLGDQLKEKLGEGVVVLASAKDGKVNLIRDRRKSQPDGSRDRWGDEAGSTCRKSCESNRRSCWRRRRWSSEHGSGRR